MLRLACLVVLAFGCTLTAAEPEVVKLTMDDQFGQVQSLEAYKGQVVVLIYGDRKATDACAKLGETVHVAFHPDAKGQPAEKARKAAVAPLGGGLANTEVAVMPVACLGKVPDAVKTLIKSQVKKGSPEVPVWLDSSETMVTKFGMTTGEPNVVVFDGKGRLRHTHNGTMTQEHLKRLSEVVQALRVETARGK
jgi:peroxiredoxin